MSSGRNRRSSSETHTLYGTIIKNSFAIDLHKKSSSGVTIYRIVFKVSFLVNTINAYTINFSLYYL